MNTYKEFECCTDAACASGLRNNYFRGKKLTPNSYVVEQQYQIERRRLLNRAIHGWGVVYGYPLTVADEGRLRIDAGFALDKSGRELVQVESVTLSLDQIIAMNKDGKRIPVCQPCGQEAQTAPWAEGCWLLSAHYAERPVAPVHIEDPCSCSRDEWDQVCETVRFSLRAIPCQECCVPNECELQCKCGLGPCCDDHKGTPDGDLSTPSLNKGEEKEFEPGRIAPRGGCRCLCEHLTGLEVGPECEKLCEIVEPCGRVRVDLNNGVALACIELGQDECGDWSFKSILDDCGPRRLVKRNDILFDLIRGCDVTRISEIGWWRWHRGSVTWDEFQTALGPPDLDNEVISKTNDFWVTFSGLVRKDTLKPDCFAISVIVSEHEGGWGEIYRVPIVAIDTTKVPAEKGDPPGYVRSATLVVDAGWVCDAVRGRETQFQCEKVFVEIQVRGDYIIDCNGQAVDANAVGLSPGPTGNGTPGGTFISTFQVGKQPSGPRTRNATQPSPQGVMP